MRLIDRLRPSSGDKQRYSIEDWYLDKNMFTFGSGSYPHGMAFSMPGEKTEEPGYDFANYARMVYKANGPVFACIYARMRLFKGARFQWQQMERGKPGDLFGTDSLGLLERPWPNGTTGELLARAEQDASLAGNFYLVNEGDRLRRLRPDWVTILLTAPPEEAVESDVAGYAYHPGNYRAELPLEVFSVEEVAHWSPIPDPEAQYRGMSWITPIIRDVMGDQAATKHKLKFFDNAGTPNLVFTLKETVTPEQFREFVKASESEHTGVENAYKNLYMGGGADVEVVGKDLRQLDFKLTQGAGETRICADAGVPPVIVGLSEGLQAATYSNYGQARRHFGDLWARPQWEDICGALESVVPRQDVRGPARLWYDAEHIAFLREDAKDAAEIEQIKASTIANLVKEGFTADSAKAAVLAQDMSLLQHTGYVSIQLQLPGVAPAASAEPVSSNGGTPND